MSSIFSWYLCRSHPTLIIAVVSFWNFVRHMVLIFEGRVEDLIDENQVWAKGKIIAHKCFRR